MCVDEEISAAEIRHFKVQRVRERLPAVTTRPRSISAVHDKLAKRQRYLATD